MQFPQRRPIAGYLDGQAHFENAIVYLISLKCPYTPGWRRSVAIS